MEELLKQWEAIKEIISLDDEDIIGGLANEDLSISMIDAIIEAAPSYVNEDRSFNEAPTFKEFHDFLTKRPEFIAECQIVSPERPDYRFMIVGVKAPISPRNRTYLYDFVNQPGINEPDEYGEYDGMIRAWWD